MEKDKISQKIFVRVGLGKKGLVVKADTKQNNLPVYSSSNISSNVALPTVQFPLDLSIPRELFDLSMPEATKINLELAETRKLEATYKKL